MSFPSGHDAQTRALAGTHEVRERPILFKAPMVNAILGDRKSQTRRVCKPGERMLKIIDKTPYGVPGDRLWVRETFFNIHHPNEWPAGLVYRASCPGLQGLGGQLVVWKPSIFMPRWASRILLEVKSVRIERLQEITEDDAVAEGCRASLRLRSEGGAAEHPSAVAVYQELWDEINAKKAPWSSNPWVWVVGFKRVRVL